MIKQFLAPFDGEAGNNNITPLRPGTVYDISQFCGYIMNIFVSSVPVSRFHYDVISLLRCFRVFQNGSVPAADIAGEDKRPGFSPLFDGDVNDR